jgi:hypothetical protein
LIHYYLIGWDGFDFNKEGILRKNLAYSAGVEEQGRNTLHGHTFLLEKGYHLLQQQKLSGMRQGKSWTHILTKCCLLLLTSL